MNSTDRQALGPCPNPWCAGTMKPLVVTEVDDAGRNIGVKVICFYDCSLSGPVCPTVAEAIAAWNTRALSRPSPSGEDVEQIIQTAIDTKARELGVVLLPKPCQKITKAVIAALSLPHKNGEVDRG